MYYRQKIKSISKSLDKILKVLLPQNSSPTHLNPLVYSASQSQEVQFHILNKQLQQQYGLSQQCLSKLFSLKCQQTDIKASNNKYLIFLKGIEYNLRIHKAIISSDLNLRENSLDYFIYMMSFNQRIIRLEISNISLVNKITPLLNLLNKNDRLVKISLHNTSLQNQSIQKIFECISSKQQIIWLDVSNRGSQFLNKIDQNGQILQTLIMKNTILTMLQLEGMNIQQKKLSSIQNGINKNQNTKLIYLNLKNNSLNKSCYPILRSIIVKSNLKELNLSENNLSNDGIVNLLQVRLGSISKINLSNTKLECEGLVEFMQKLRDNKKLKTLILDKNDFSGYKFKNTYSHIRNNKGLLQLSLVDCRINYLESLFDSLIYNYFLEKLNVSYNSFDKSYEELGECLEKNKVLMDLNLKFCGINSDTAKKIAKSLIINKNLKVLDLSQNRINEQSGKYLLKCVQQNNSIQIINLDKTQIDINTRKMLRGKLQHNLMQKIRRQKELFIQQNQNVTFKNQEIQKQLEEIMVIYKINSQNLSKLQNEVSILNEKLVLKKKLYNEYLNNSQFQILRLNREFKFIQNKTKLIPQQFQVKLNQLNKKIDQTKLNINKQQQKVKLLEDQLKNQKNNLKSLESNLQNDYQNKKYLYRKHSLSLPRISKKLSQQYNISDNKSGKTHSRTPRRYQFEKLIL